MRVPYDMSLITFVADISNTRISLQEVIESSNRGLCHFSTEDVKLRSDLFTSIFKLVRFK
jgi:hypothetical protein